MDEYLFILLAKLKADRLRQAREERIAEASQQDLFEGSGVATTRSPHRASGASRRFSTDPDWPLRT